MSEEHDPVVHSLCDMQARALLARAEAAEKALAEQKERSITALADALATLEQELGAEKDDLQAMVAAMKERERTGGCKYFHHTDSYGQPRVAELEGALRGLLAEPCRCGCDFGEHEPVDAAVAHARKVLESK